MDNPVPLHFGPVSLPPNSDKAIGIVAALITIVGAVLVIRAKNSSSSGTDLSGDTSGTSVTTAQDPQVADLISTIQGLTSEIHTANNTPPPATIQLGFSTENSVATDLSGSSSGSSNSSGAGGISLFGVTLGGSSGRNSSSSSQQSLNQSIGNTFSTSASITGGTADEITQLEAFLASEAGTSSQRAQEANQASQQAYTYLNHTVSPSSTPNTLSDMAGQH